MSEQRSREQREEAGWRERRLMAIQTRVGLKWLRTHGWDTRAVTEAIVDMQRCVERATKRIGDG